MKKYSIPWIKKFFSFCGKDYLNKPSSEPKGCCRKLKEQQNIEAFLKTVRKCEGTNGPNGYLMLFGGSLFDNFNRHPNKTVHLSGYASTAAGAYQFLHSTWSGLNLQNFSPQMQDKGAIMLIKRRDALKDVKAGRLHDAVWKCSYEWASMPPGRYGQPKKSFMQVKKFFLNEGGTLA